MKKYLEEKDMDGGIWDPPGFDAGCCANVILIAGDKIYCANIGDSMSFLCGNK